MIDLELPWPPRTLWPNGRANWRLKSACVKLHRRTAWALMREVVGAGTNQAKTFHLAYTFCPSARRDYDLDNALGACKSYTDGIAEALCVNDRSFTFSIERGEVVKGGAVKVRLTWPPS